MTFKEHLKSFFTHFKKFWIIYLLVIFIFAFGWFILCWGNITKVSDYKNLQIWFSVDETLYPEDSLEYKNSEEYYNQSQKLIENLIKNNSKYGNKKYTLVEKNLTLNNSTQRITFSNYMGYTDLVILPQGFYKDDSLINPETNKEWENQNDRLDVSNYRIISKLCTLEELLDSSHKDYQEYISLLNTLKEKNKIIDFTHIDFNKNETTRNVGFKLNEGYVLSFSTSKTINQDYVLQLVKDIVAL